MKWRQAVKMNPVTFKWMQGECVAPIVGQYPYVGVKITKDYCGRDAHISK